MRLIFELSGEDTKLAKAEVFSLFHDYKVLFDLGMILGLEVSMDLDEGGDRDPKVEDLRLLAMTHCVSEILGESDDIKEDIIESAKKISIEKRPLSVRCRKVKDCKLRSGEVERAVGEIFYQKGFKIDLREPKIEIKIIICVERAFIARKICDCDKKFLRRNPMEMPFFYPGVLNPKLARVLVNLCGLEKGERLLDPMCGSGGILIEGASRGLEVFGVDVRGRMVEGAFKNLRFSAFKGYSLMVGDSRNLCFKDRSMDGIVVDMPYGQSSPIIGKSARELYYRSMEEIFRIFKKRCVVVAREDLSEIAESIGFRSIERYEQRVHRSLTRKILVLS